MNECNDVNDLVLSHGRLWVDDRMHELSTLLDFDEFDFEICHELEAMVHDCYIDTSIYELTGEVA